MSALGSFEIFRTILNGEPTWMETCANLEAAMERAQEMDSAQQGGYFIFDRQNRKFVDACPHRAIESVTRILTAEDHEHEEVRRDRKTPKWEPA